MVRRSNPKYHDRVAGRYDQVYDSHYWRAYRDLSWQHLKRHLPPLRPAWAADLGCGTGWFGLRLLRAGFNVVFLDPSGKMLARARDAVEAEPSRGVEARFVQAGIEHMAEIDDGSLAFATAQGDPLSFCEDVPRALRELRRCMALGGHVVLSVDNRVAGVRTLLNEGATERALELLASGRTEWRGQRGDERFPMHMFDPGELDEALGRAGFEPLSRIGKTCVISRRDEELLADPIAKKRLLSAEQRVHGRAEWLGLASHFQVAARRRGGSA